MKTIKIFSILAAAIFALAACTDNGINSQGNGGNKTTDPEIECTAEKSYSVADKGVEVIYFSILSNTPWTIEVQYQGASKDWVSLNRTSGGKTGLEEEVTLTIADNTLDTEREATVSIKGEGIAAPISFTVTQAAKANLEISALNPSGAISFEGGEVSFTVTSNKSWTITSDAQSWLSLDKTSGSAGATTVKATASNNEQTVSRRATLTIATDSDSKELVIEQAAFEKIIELKFATILEEEKTFSALGGTKSIAIEGGATEADWNVLVSTPFAETYGTVTNGEDYIGLTLPLSRFAARGPVTLKLMTNGELTDQITLYQESLLVPHSTKGVNCVADNTKGTLTVKPSNEANGNAVINLKNGEDVFGFKFGSICYNLSEVNITKGEIGIECWASGYQIQIYAGLRNKYYVSCNNVLNWTDWKAFSNVPARNEINSIKFVMNSLSAGALPTEVWINNNKVANNSHWVNNQAGLKSIPFDFCLVASGDENPCEGYIVIESVVVEVIE